MEKRLEAPEIDHLVQEIDRLISEMTALRRQVAALGTPPPSPTDSIRKAEFFGMWANRPDMQGKSSREWLNELRPQHYGHEQKGC
jgi:hypothetical protein